MKVHSQRYEVVSLQSPAFDRAAIPALTKDTPSSGDYSTVSQLPRACSKGVHCASHFADGEEGDGSTGLLLFSRAWVVVLLLALFVLRWFRL